MKKSLVFFLSIAFLSTVMLTSTSCEDDLATLPSFLKIDTIVVDSTSYDSTGSTASKINFAWVYINDNLQGVYLLPCNVPVIGEGVKNFRIFAGVYEFGNGSNATRYIFYDEYKITDTLVVQDTLELTPHVRYNVGLDVPFVDDFEVGNNFTLETNSGGYWFPNYNVDVYEGDWCGYMVIDSSENNNNLVLRSTDPIYVPDGLSGYFIELNYKCNAPFYLDIYSSTGAYSIVGFNTKNEWNKAYINITTPIDLMPGTDVRIKFTVPKGDEVPQKQIFIDNLKFIFRP